MMSPLRTLRLLVLGLVLSAGAIGVIQAQNNDPKGYVEGLIGDLVSSDGQKVEVFGLTVSLTGNVQAERVTVSDIEGAWLEIGDLSLDWQPFSLLGDVLTINSLDVGNIEFRRAAKQPPTQSSGETPAPRPVSVERFVFRNITLFEELVGEKVELTASGSLGVTADPVRIAVDARIERTDDVAGSFAAKIEYQPETERLAMDIRGTDGPGGVIGNLLKVPGSPELQLAIRGDGRIDAWDGRISMKAGADEALSGDIRIAGVEGGRRVGMSLTGSLSAYVPDALKPAFLDRSALAGSVLFPETGNRIALESLFLETAAVSIEASGGIDTVAGDTSLRLSVTSPDGETAVAQLDGTGDVTVSALKLQAGLSGDISNPQWTLNGQARRIRAGPDSAADLRITGASQPAGTAGSGFAVNLSTRLESSRDAAWMASLRGAVEASVTGSYGSGQPFIVRSAQLKVPAGQVGTTGSLQPADGKFDLEVDARLSRLMTGITLVDRLLSDPTTLSGRIARNAPGAPLSLSGLTLSSPALSAKLDGTLAEQSVDLRAVGRLSDLSRLSEAAGGAVDFTAGLNGDIDAPDIALKAAGQGITLSGKPFENPALEFTGRLSPSAPTGKFALSGRYAGSPVTAAFALDHQPDGTRVLSDLTAEIARAKLSGELRLPPDNRPAGQLAFEAPDLGGLGDFLLVELEGAASGSVDLSPEGASSRAAIRASGSQIRAAGLAIETLSADVTIADISKPAQLVGKVAAGHVRQGEYAVDALNLTAERDGSAYAIDLDASGKSISGTASARLEPQAERLVVNLTGADLTIAGTALRLERPGLISIGDQETQIEPLRLSLSGGTLDVEGRYGKSLNLKIGADGIPLSIADTFAPELGLTGSLSGNATVTGRADAPEVSFEASAAQTSTAALRQAGLPPLGIDARGEMAGNVLTLNASASGAAATELTTSGRIDLKNGVRLDLAVRGQVPIALFADELARSGVRASGLATPDLQISGTAATPQISGTVAISDATFGDADGRFIVRGASAQLRLDGDQVEIVSLSGSTAGGGTVSATGSGGLSADSPISATIQVRSGRYIDGTLVVGTLDADLNVSGSRSAGLLIAGDVVLLKTTITLDSLPPAARQLTDVVHRQPPVPVARQWALLQERRRTSGGSDTVLDITVRTAKPILVLGRGINADFGGRLQISGTTDNIQPTGRFNLLRGSVTIVGRRLEFDRGTLVFTGSLNPEIDIAATGTTPDASVTLLLSGFVDRPKVSITSVPELPPEEALASLVFQQSSTELSPIQLARLADAILVLSGGARSGLFEGFRRAVGIDRLDVTTDSSGQTSVGAGRYLNEKTYLGVEQGVETGTTKLTIDLDVTRNIKLRAGASTVGETEAGILFEKEY